MRKSSAAVVLFMAAAAIHDDANRVGVEAFAPAAFTATSQRQMVQQRVGLFMSQQQQQGGEAFDLNEFDYLLGEGNFDGSQQKPAFTPTPSRRQILVGGAGSKQVLLASTAAASPDNMEDYNAIVGDADTDAATPDADPYADMGLAEVKAQAQRLANPNQGTFSENMEARLRKMDLQDVIGTFILPSILVFAGSRWVFNRAAERATASLDTTLDSFASEMVHHDGNDDEMRLCFNTYSKKLMFLGPKKAEVMLKRYLQLYAKKKTVSPQAIKSLSTVFSLFDLSEERAAQILVSLCRALGGEKISSSGKLLFLGSRILQSSEGLAALEPIKDMIKATYREQTVAETLVETSQQAMGEAAYRATIQAAGHDQTSLTPGWKVLGLDEETATAIFEEEAKTGFKSMREIMYGGQSQKYDAKGNPITKEGELKDPENAIGQDEGGNGSDDNEVTSNVYECGECGFTLFIAKGREDKFYGEGFKCPECGATKDKFNARDLDDE